MTKATAPSVTSVTPQPGSPSTSEIAASPWLSGSTPLRRIEPSSAIRAGRPRASSGRSASIGITAMSWVSSTENEERPPAVASRSFSDRVCSTIAVEDSEKISPIASAVWNATPSRIPPSVSSAVVTTICSPPRPRSRWRMSHSACGESSRPIRNSIMTTPNSAKCLTFSASEPTIPSSGPIAMPASR